LKNRRAIKMENIKDYLGKEVTVKMDRQLGTKHPK